MTDATVEIARTFVATAQQLRDLADLPATVPGEVRAAVGAGTRRGMSYLSAEGVATFDIWYGERHGVLFPRGATLDATSEGMVVAAVGVEVAFGELVVDLTGLWPVEASPDPVPIGGMAEIAAAVSSGALQSALVVAGSDPGRLWALGFTAEGLVSGILTDDGESTDLEPVSAFDAWTSLRTAALA